MRSRRRSWLLRMLSTEEAAASLFLQFKIGDRTENTIYFAAIANENCRRNIADLPAQSDVGFAFRVDSSHDPPVLDGFVGSAMHFGALRVTLGHEFDRNAIPSRVSGNGNRNELGKEQKAK